MGTLVFAGHGGSSANHAIDATAAGDIWDGFDGAAAVAVGVTGAAIKDSAGGTTNSIFYTATIFDGWFNSKCFLYSARRALVNETETGYALTYTGVEGLTLSYAQLMIDTGTTATSGEQTTMKAILCLWSSNCWVLQAMIMILVLQQLK